MILKSIFSYIRRNVNGQVRRHSFNHALEEYMRVEGIEYVNMFPPDHDKDSTRL